MTLTLLTLHAPHHPMEWVGEQVVKEGLTDRLKLWHQQCGARELIYLATCQRVLWMLWGGNAEALAPRPETLRMDGSEAWAHLLRLATGLESATLGDHDVLNQISDALQAAREAGTAGQEAACAIEDILREAQRLRARIGLAHGQASVASVALRCLEETLPTRASIVLVGIGPMTTHLAQCLPGRGFRVTLANRTQMRAEALAQPLGLPVISLDALQRNPAGFDALVSATASALPLFTLEAWKTLAHPGLLLLDLALPPDSEPSLGNVPWIKRRDLQVMLAETELTKARRAEAARAAEHLLKTAVERLMERAKKRARKRLLSEDLAKVNAAFDTLAARTTIHNAPLLKRGRTLAHRALVRGGDPEPHIAYVSDVLHLEEA